MLTENLQELHSIGFLSRIENQHILNELKRNKSNAKKIALVGVFYGDIDEYITGKELEEFYNFLSSFDASSLLQADQYQSNKYKTEYKEVMNSISEGWV
tara:strand:+ start:1543 stop:1839 length:297 start_codon:yes stop_codon:yes gene_type:complete